jgi:Ca2+-binding EF-hand superfamily protein
LFEVFKKFDKDGNGTVESNELIAISKEMNEEIT